ncbi:hypothetical protein [Chryseobacterium sp. FH2]|uniref:hypothetical protein n=1 Tax=Chryseobacterium sp. FH2 TaxID=1674291 RepID=UPI000ABC5134|nr:hypothetical protein [Chryseobacterium sp. FH2]
MNFLRYYPYESEEAKIYHSKRIKEDIFLAGYFKGSSGVFTRLDFTGNPIFQKAYNFSDTISQVSFRKIIRNTEGLILLGLEKTGKEENIPFLLKVNFEGDIIWYKKFPEIIVNNEEIFLEEINNFQFGLGFFDLGEQKSKVFLFDERGEIFLQNDINSIDERYTFIISGLNFHNEEILICGNESDPKNEKKLPKGIRIIADLGFKDINAEYIIYKEDFIILTSIQYTEREIILTGLTWDTPQIPLVFEYNHGLGYLFDNYAGVKTNFVFGDDYFVIYTESDEISRIQYGAGTEWSGVFQMEDFNINDVSEDLMLLHGEDKNIDFAGILNPDFESCKTTPIELISFSFIEFVTERTEINIKETRVENYYGEGIEKQDLENGFSEVCDGGGITVTFNQFSSLQTPNFYLQAVGSTGSDSTQGMHLRWSFGGELGENHLPKGNLASTNVNFNKPEDFVKIYRAPYVKSIFTLDLSVAPQLIDDSQKLWVYKFNNNTRIFYIYFKNQNKYAQVRAGINPLTNPLGFIIQYGNELIEIQCRSDLFFACSLVINNQSPTSSLQLETLSLPENNNTLSQYLSYRKRLSFWDLNSNYFNAEHGKTIRYRPDGCIVKALQFEFYSDFIVSTNNGQGWTLLGQFSLTTDGNEAFSRLDPIPQSNPVNGAWLRYNDAAYVNTNNYKTKWEHPSQNPLDRDIKTVVEQYIKLSDLQPNPKAFETLNINLANSSINTSATISNGDPGQGDTQISNLDILNVAALDYHTARMLGLGHLDIGSDALGVIGINEGFIYLAEYYTNANLDIKATEKNMQLLSMSLPTNIFSERLSLPVKLSQIVTGMGTPNSNLYDSNGYSPDGKTRYISLYNESLDTDQINPVFFSTDNLYDASKFTNPVYAGLEYRMVKPGETDFHIWAKPELSHDTAYLNIDSASDSFEVIPIQIPDANTPLYLHKQKKNGTYFYMSYGINWFSRAQYGQPELSIVTDIKPFNGLLPPSLCSSFLIQKEFPLMFTSQEEQNRLIAIPALTDKTLVRHTFDYHIYQEGVTYPIPFDSVIQDSVYLSDPNSLFPDNEEIFADDIEIYFRKFVPRTITARVKEQNQLPVIMHHSGNQLLAIIETVDYPVASSGFTVDPNNPNNLIYNEIWRSEIPAGSTANDFLGGIFLLDNESYVIHEITLTGTGLQFTVFKKVVSDAMMSGNTNSTFTATQLAVLPSYDSSTEGIFNATENMQNAASWGFQNPNSLKVKIGDSNWTLHREIIENQQANGTPQKYLEKSRGIWKDAKVEMLFEDLHSYQPLNSNLPVITYDPNNLPKVHQGVYKITFTGFSLAQHSQYSQNSHSVEWNKGYIRLFNVENFNPGGWPKDSRSIFKVVRTENIGTNNDLVLYIYDENFAIEEDTGANTPILLHQNQAGNYISKPTDPVTGNSVKVNYYPSYKVYLYKNTTNNLISDSVLPQGDEDTHYSVFGFRSVDNNTTDMQGNLYKSKFSTPSLMFGSAIIEPMQPELPTGSVFATRPDKYGKATYSFLTKYTHKPHSVQFFRSDETAFLNALYEFNTIGEIKAALESLGGQNEEYFNDRWKNFLDFENLEALGDYTGYPLTSSIPYKFPLPDSITFFKAINQFITEHNDYFDLQVGSTYYCEQIPNTQFGFTNFKKVIIKAIPNQSEELLFVDFVMEAIQNCFIPLTEVPVIYKYIKKLNSGYRPKNLKQNLRDSNGYLLNPIDPTFDMAPMAAIYKETPQHETLFTDFTLDGSSDNFYFYGVREMGTQMKLSGFSPFLGPIRLVNSNPAEPPKIKSLLPIVENKTLGISSKIKIEINPYPNVQKISQISVYRATNKLDAESVLSMKLIKMANIADVETEQVSGAWVVYDDFEDLDYKPYGDALFYKVVVSRTVEYTMTDYDTGTPTSQVIVEQAPSLSSKTIVTVLVENYNPEAPELNYNSEPVTGDTITSVILNWEQTCYKGKYHLYKLSNEGSWKEIARINIDEKDIEKAHLYLFAEPVTIPPIDPYWEMVNTYNIVNNRLFLPLDDINMNPMPIKDSNENVLYHHFKVVAENTSNMFSIQENILTIYKKDTWADISGISSDGIDGMILQGTFIIRP